MSSRKLKLLKASRLKTLSQNSFIRYCTTVLNIQPFESIPGKVFIEKSRGGRFIETGIEVWAGLGLIGSTEKKSLGRL